jgi:hypothetical protein
VQVAKTGSIVCSGLSGGAPEWLDDGGWRLYASASDTEVGTSVRSFARDDATRVHVRIAPSGDVHVPFSFAAAYRAYTHELWRDASRNVRLPSGAVGLFYRTRALIPRRAQLALRRMLIRAQGVPAFPAWPLDDGLDRLLRLFAECALRAAGRDEGEFAWFWPDGHHAAMILTHDVESDEGIRLALELADLEEERGFRSSFNFGAWYDIDPAVLSELRTRGFEIGSHALTHDRRLFESRASFEERLPHLRRHVEELGAVGFRSPATHRVIEWLHELPVEYDCTVPHSDPYEPQPGGCCSVWPYMLGPVVELPYTLPQDHTLLTLLGRRSAEVWIEQARAIKERYGLIQCPSHPDRGYLGDSDKRAIYRDFLDALKDDDTIWRALPREVAAWWRRRGTGVTPTGTVRVDGDGGVTFVPPRAQAL